MLNKIQFQHLILKIIHKKGTFAEHVKVIYVFRLRYYVKSPKNLYSKN